jgi:putative oxidoreductase
METLKRCYRGWIHALRYVQPVFLLAIRVLVGWGFVDAGWGKLANVPATAAYFAGLHIPMPTLNVYMAGTAEAVGGALLILGAASRLITIPLIGTMIVAYATAHKEIFSDLFADPNSFVKEFLGPAAPPTPYLIVVCVVLLFGPGLFSVDGLLKRFVIDPKCPHEARPASDHLTGVPTRP